MQSGYVKICNFFVSARFNNQIFPLPENNASTFEPAGELQLLTDTGIEAYPHKAALNDIVATW